MNIEDKELLLKDLSARLPYGVKIELMPITRGKCTTLTPIILHDYFISNDVNYLPYLRPMSSMTEDEFKKLKEYSGLVYDQLDLASFQDGAYKCLDFYLNEVPADVVILVFDWLNAHHFDFRNLIGRGLAIDCTGLNVY